MTGSVGLLGLWSTASGTRSGPSGLKDPITGVLPRDVGSASGSDVDKVAGVVADVYWSLLQPTEGGDIDTAATAAHSYVEIVNALALRYSNSHPTAALRGQPVPVRVRVHCGDHSPDWAKVLGAPAGVTTGLTICDAENLDGSTLFVVPWWWSAAFLNAWEELQRKLAALLEPNPQIREVASHPATTVYAEPFQRGTRKNPNGTLLTATTGPNAGKSNVQVFYEAMQATDSRAGYADVQMSGSRPVGPAILDGTAIQWPLQMVDQVINGATATMTRWRSFGWETTRYYLPFNPFQQWQVTSTSPFNYQQVADPGGFTAKTMGLTTVNMQSRAVEGNNSLRVPLNTVGSSYPRMYANLVAQTTANGFQTATLPRLLSAYQTVYPSASNAQALAATLDVAFGAITSTNDRLGLLSPTNGGPSALRARSVELPPGWGSVLTLTQALAYNTLAQSNPTGD